jgi:hypothetical protein
MSTSQRSFDQVKSILGKLDRDIDAARERRLQRHPAPVPQAAGYVPPPMQVVQPLRQAAPIAPPAANDPGRSGYGRARPLRSDDRSSFPPSQPRP